MRTVDLGNDLKMEIKEDSIMFISNGRIYGEITKDPLKVGKKYDGVNNQLPLKYRPTKDSWINWDELYSKVTEKSAIEMRNEAFANLRKEREREDAIIKEKADKSFLYSVAALGVLLTILILSLMGM